MIGASKMAFSAVGPFVEGGSATPQPTGSQSRFKGYSIEGGRKMLMRVVFPVLVVVAGVLALCAAAVAVAQSPAELLEKGIYTEQTVGDLDGAIKIYEKIIAEAKANREFVAQAQFRLGQCLLKQGKTQQAEKAFQALVDQFKDSPAQKDLVEKARNYLPGKPGLKLDPAPWVDGESLELRVKLAGGLEIGDFILSVRSAKAHGRDVWDMRLNRDIMVNTPNLGLSRVLADKKTFRPLSSTFRHSLLGTVEADYGPNEVTIHSKDNSGKESTRKMELDGVHYDNEQGWQVFRRLPLTDNYQGRLPICATFGAGPVDLEVQVTGKESVEVPAGEFDCYKLLVKPVQQTFWISRDPHRYVVKFEAGGVVGVLQSVRQIKPGETLQYTNDKIDFSLTAPTDWYFVPVEEEIEGGENVVVIFDPQAESVSKFVSSPLESLGEESKKSARAWADEQLAKLSKAYKDFQVRADSWQQREVSGLPAVSCVADYVQGDLKRARYFVFVLGSSTATAFSADTAADRLDEFRKQFDKIVDSYKAK
jgi:tetratricopeptide (TPR) repeat protein